MANSKESYICLSAVLKAREPKLLSDERALRVLDAQSFEDAAKQIAECGYEDMSAMSAAEIGETLSRRRDGILSELDRLCPDKAIVDLFRIKYDYHNIKSVMKAEAAGTDAGRLLSASGRFPTEKLREDYYNESFSGYPGLFSSAVSESRETLARTGNPQLADFILDRAYFAELKATAEASGCSFTEGYVTLLIDTANLKTVVRTLRMGKDSSFMKDAVIPGGRVEAGRVLKIENAEGIDQSFTDSIIKNAAQEGAKAVAGGGLTEFEKACDNAVNTYLKEAKLSAYGPDVVTAYIAALESEITAVRMILTGILAGISAESIKERLRDMYA